MFEKEKIYTEDLAYWFFRLNGCLCLKNFLVHHERIGIDGTEIDILATRFPYRRELSFSDKPMEDHSLFLPKTKIDLIIAEVTRSTCKLNGPWTNPSLQNMDRVLHIIGAFPESTHKKIVESLYTIKYYENDKYRCRIFSIGQFRNDSDEFQGVTQITWEEILEFIFERFVQYRKYKTSHNQWDDTGKLLFELADQHKQCQEHFTQDVMRILVSNIYQ